MSIRALPTAVVLLTLTGVAHADLTLTVAFELQADEDQNGDYDAVSTVNQEKFFSRARCLCQTPVRYELTSTDADLHDADPVHVWIGSDCKTADREMREQNCDERTELGFDVTALRTGHNLDVSVDRLSLNGCDVFEKDPETLWLLVDENNDETFEHDQSTTYTIDFQPPTLTSTPVAEGVENGFSVRWSLNEADDDVLGYQVLCAQNGLPVFDSPQEPIYELSQQLCDEVDPAAGVGGDVTPAVDAGAGDPDAAPAPDAPATSSGGIFDLDARFVCSGSISATETTTRVSLPADVLAAGGVDVYLAVVDRHGNAKLYAAGTDVRAAPVTDFWEAYSDSGGKAKGGFCAVTPTGSRAGIGGAVALLAGAVLFAVRRRRALAALLAVSLAPALASAQVVLDEETEEDPLKLPDSEWVFELKFGPYYPAVDEESGLSGKPFETMFGAKENFMAQVELDRFFLWPFGQLGIGASVGYMQDTARAYKEDEAGNPIVTPDPGDRATDKTRFRLFPTSLLAVYRFTHLADRTPVPIVPYAKLGLSYYVWWITKGDGSTSESANGDGKGATLGWQGTLGLSLRADFLDPQATRNLALDFGIEHAGFFIEYTHADVSGLGSAEKLHVGDSTWSAGVNFEF
jgi:MYXO-CTERM domain-containing protein